MSDHFHRIIDNEEGCVQYNPTSGLSLASDIKLKSPSKTIGSIIKG